MKSKNAGARQVAIVAAAVVATAGLAGSVGATPAAAAPSIARCQAHTTGPTFDPVRKTVTGAHFLFCDPDTVVDLPVGITRDGRAVAEGRGSPSTTAGAPTSASSG